MLVNCSCKLPFSEFRFMQIWHKDEAFLRVSWVPGKCTGNVKISIVWTDMWNKMTEEKAGSSSRIPRLRVG